MRSSALIVFSILAIVSPAHADPLTLIEVLRSASVAHPDISVARAGIEEAEAGRTAARGAFDLKLEAEGGYAPVGKYDKPRGMIGLRQPTALAGLELWTRYENGADFAPYDGGLVTSEAGKASLGFLLPLLRGRAIDEARLRKYVSEIELEVAQQEQRLTRAAVLAEAADLWWKWVIVGEKLSAYRVLLDQAEKRREFLEEQLAAGAIPRVELIDNQRLLAQRKVQLARLNLEFRQLSLQMGLFRRGEHDVPAPARPEELPALPTFVPPETIGRAGIRTDLAQVPALRVYDLSLRILHREMSAAENEQLPFLDFQAATSRSFGSPRPYSAIDESVTETTVSGKLTLSWDVQQRKASGKAGMLRAKRRALEAKRRLYLERLELSVEAQLASLRAQLEMATLSREATREARRVSQAEADSFELGQSNVLAVNLREQAAISTYLDELDAILAFQSAWVKLQRLLGNDAPEAYLPPSGSTELGLRETIQ